MWSFVTHDLTLIYNKIPAGHHSSSLCDLSFPFTKYVLTFEFELLSDNLLQQYQNKIETYIDLP